MGWRIEVDDDLCQGHGVCEAEAPGVFDAPPRHKVRIIDAAPGDDQRAAVELAVKYCPTHALRIVEEPGGGPGGEPGREPGGNPVG